MCDLELFYDNILYNLQQQVQWYPLVSYLLVIAINIFLQFQVYTSKKHEVIESQYLVSYISYSRFPANFCYGVQFITSATNKVWLRYYDRYRLSVHLSVCPSVCYQDSGNNFESIITIFGKNLLIHSRRNPIKFESSCWVLQCTIVRFIFLKGQ